MLQKASDTQRDTLFHVIPAHRAGLRKRMVVTKMMMVVMVTIMAVMA